MSNAESIVAEYTERWTTNRGAHDEQYVPEKYQLGIVVDFFQTAGIDYATEKSIFSYPIDVLCVNGDETLAIELKSRNIGKGIDQALRDSDFVDFAFLAVWAGDVSENLVERVAELPIGLMAVDESVEILSTNKNTPTTISKGKGDRASA